MFAFICGEVVNLEDNSAVIKNNGIGYELCVSSNTIARLQTGLETQLFTYLQVKEDGLTLFGFATQKEKTLFLKLLSVSGVGPKLAIAVLSGLSLNDLATAIVSGDVAALTTIKGLGKKTAERIVLELKEKLSAENIVLDKQSENRSELSSPSANEAISVLISLGLGRSEAAARVKNAIKNGAATTEDLLSFALKNG